MVALCRRDIVEYVADAYCSKIKAVTTETHQYFFSNPEIPDWKIGTDNKHFVTKLPTISSGVLSNHFRTVKVDSSHHMASFSKAMSTRRRNDTAYHPQTATVKVEPERMKMASESPEKAMQIKRRKPLEFRMLEIECFTYGILLGRVKLPQELSCVHDTFHVSNLKKCLAEPDVQVHLDEIEIDKNL
ncbi:hypothetical protein Tco_0499790 [Tanacetum coccineum]